MQNVWVKDLRKGDQADVSNIIQKRPNIGVHLKVDEVVRRYVLELNV